MPPAPHSRETTVRTRPLPQPVAVIGAALCAVLLMSLVACGRGSGPSLDPPVVESDGTPGGALTVVATGDTDFVDPGRTYYAFGTMISDAVNRPLLSYPPGSPSVPVPDLAREYPTVSGDGRTVTVRIRPGVRYAPPVNREVTSDDIKYAIERTFSAGVSNPYVEKYFESLVGVPPMGTDGVPDIAGLTTPDSHTLVIRLNKPEGNRIVTALVLPVTVPVPREYAAPHDARSPSTYDRYVAFTGPYMVRNDPSTGELIGWQPGERMQIVRNPNWNGDETGDYRPAFADQITVEMGATDRDQAARRVVEGTRMICCDRGSPPLSTIAELLPEHRTQIQYAPGGGTRYVALDTKSLPFKNVTIRRAVSAALDRDEIRDILGGDVAGRLAQGWIPPGVAGFEEAGGDEQNSDLDFLHAPTGNAQVARKYMNRAQRRKMPIRNGRWIGRRAIQMIGIDEEPDRAVATVVRDTLIEMGFRVNMRLVSRDEAYARYCGRPSVPVAVCPNVAWYADFADPQTLLQPTFSGRAITPRDNANWPRLDVTVVNRAINQAALLPIGPDRNAAWAEVNHLIAERAPGIPLLWDHSVVVNSADVKAVINPARGTPDLAFTSLR